MPTNEAGTRTIIDEMLRESGWRLPNSDAPNVRMEQHTGAGQPDYTLNDSRGFPIGVVEAKNSDIDPLSAKEQARGYATELRVRFVVLSNGTLHFLWDVQTGNPITITKMPTQQSLENRARSAISAGHIR